MSYKSLFLVFACSLTVGAQAVILHDNLSPTFPHFDLINGWNVTTTRGIAMPFTSPGGLQLTSVTLVLSHNAGPDPIYHVSINQGGAVTPGASLYSWDTLPERLDPFFTVLTPSTQVNLDAGDYYLVVSGGPGTWAHNNTGDFGPFSFQQSNGTWNTFSSTRSAYRVEAAPVPEPASLLALGGLTAFAIRRRRKLS